ncbi:elongation factor P--(R)-beta-lysine ligase [Thalassotalea loyana]|uniref:Elongation factor P--(R)-beta-lysine ligase n=1 Tax=Thalassotalea loyana TaxID=280483 RepID=A0ABQ6HJX6_9GAMM|nr:elongation factor P--(R)-beta-lysine ligase [Thalassotalea loyana]GLX87400.1 elongation factor P--(R)-beta-lysine ligase [Thalassotalea loyana]
MWQSTMSWENAQKRAALLMQLRAFFFERGVIEVETPLLSAGTVTDVHLDAFATDYQFPVGKQSLYLQTSPEFAMKRLLASSYQSIFQLCKAFRDEPFGRYHNPEFTMLEWYRIGFDHFELMDEVDLLLQSLLGCDEATRMSYQDAFLTYTHIDPLNCSCGQLVEFLKDKDKADDWLISSPDLDTLLQFIFCEFVEPNIGKLQPALVYDFPASQASLAKISSEDPRVAHRFECYFKGVELANGFNELTSHEIQESRFNHDNRKRASMNLDEKPIDKKFLSALEHGLPQCAGVALGVDRLIMLALGCDHIEQVLSFTIENA